MTLWLGCWVILHAPDGSHLQVNSDFIIALRPGAGAPEHHLAHGTKAIIYMSGKVFGTTESVDEVLAAIKQCQEDRT